MNGELYITNSSVIYKIIDTSTASTTSFENSGFSLHPNPTKNILHILLPKSKNISKFNIEIFNNIGNKVLEINKTNVSTDQIVEIIDISTLPLGVYILHVTTDELNRSEKVIKE